MVMVLENPKTFLPLLLFVGFVFTLMSVPTSEVARTASVNLPDFFGIGMALIVLAIVLFVIVNILLRK
ncbi:MAG: hypothetical protein QXO23_04620 [Candidatus Methanomethyliaceae archaeon]